MDQEQQPPPPMHQNLAASHLLQHTLRGICTNPNSHWLYAVFWRILPRNYPPPRWDLPGSIYDRSRGNRRNWILAWEDGFCNFTATTTGENPSTTADSSIKGLQPDLFFKMSHEIYSFGEGSVGKVAADHGHKWVFREPARGQDANLQSPWHNPSDSHPRTWEAQFQAGIQTIALIAVREGVVQLGALNKVEEDLNYVVLLRKTFSYLENIPGVFLPHPSTAAAANASALEGWSYHHQPPELFGHPSAPPAVRIMPSMNSLEVLLSKLPSVGSPSLPSPSGSASRLYEPPPYMTVAKQEVMEEEGFKQGIEGECMHSANDNNTFYGNFVDKTQ